MPPRPVDNAAYRDVLMFEERLKTTAASLQRRKAKYQCKYTPWALFDAPD